MNHSLTYLFETLAQLVDNNAQSEVEMLFEKWPILSEATRGDTSALRIVRDDIKMLKIALKYGVNPDLRDSVGNTLLMDSSGIGDFDQVEILLEYAADVNAQNCSGESPLSIAVARGNVEIAVKLMKAGADIAINVGGVNLGVWADLSGSVKMQTWIYDQFKKRDIT